MSIFQSDVSRQFKIVVTACVGALLALGYLLYGYLHASKQHPTDISPIQAGQGVAANESEHYSDVLRRYNRANASAAIDTGDTYLSAMSSRAQQVAPGPDRPRPVPQEPTAPPPPAPQIVPAQPTVAAPADARQLERIGEQVLAFVGEWTPTAHSTARQSDVPAAGSTGATARVPSRSSSGSEERPNYKLVPAFALAAAELGTDLDTDENSWVFARIPVGEYAGATLHAPGYKRNNNAVDITFTFMEWRGHTYHVNAKAVDKNSMRTSLSGEVNNRYDTRILLPSIATGLGKAGQLYEQADTQTVTTPLGGVIQTRSGPPSAQAVRGTIIGGMATEAGRVLRSDAAQLPSKQVLVPRGEMIGIRFLNSVFTANDVDAAERSSAGAPAASGESNDAASKKQPLGRGEPLAAAPDGSN